MSANEVLLPCSTVDPVGELSVGERQSSTLEAASNPTSSTMVDAASANNLDENSHKAELAWCSPVRVDEAAETSPQDDSKEEPITNNNDTEMSCVDSTTAMATIRVVTDGEQGDESNLSAMDHSMRAEEGTDVKLCDENENGPMACKREPTDTFLAQTEEMHPEEMDSPLGANNGDTTEPMEGILQVKEEKYEEQFIPKVEMVDHYATASAGEKAVSGVSEQIDSDKLEGLSAGGTSESGRNTDQHADEGAEVENEGPVEEKVLDGGGTQEEGVGSHELGERMEAESSVRSGIENGDHHVSTDTVELSEEPNPTEKNNHPDGILETTNGERDDPASASGGGVIQMNGLEALTAAILAKESMEAIATSKESNEYSTVGVVAHGDVIDIGKQAVETCENEATAKESNESSTDGVVAHGDVVDIGKQTKESCENEADGLKTLLETANVDTPTLAASKSTNKKSGPTRHHSKDNERSSKRKDVRKSARQEEISDVNVLSTPRRKRSMPDRFQTSQEEKVIVPDAVAGPTRHEEEISDGNVLSTPRRKRSLPDRFQPSQEEKVIVPDAVLSTPKVDPPVPKTPKSKKTPTSTPKKRKSPISTPKKGATATPRKRKSPQDTPIEIKLRPQRAAASDTKKAIQKSLFYDNAADSGEEAEDDGQKSNKATDEISRKLRVRPPPLLLNHLPTAPLSEYYEEESAWRFQNPGFPLVAEDDVDESNEVNKLTSIRVNVDLPVRKSFTELQPLPPSPQLPKFPSTNFCRWTFDPQSRVLLANFRDRIGSRRKKKVDIKVEEADEAFLFEMMERDDITVVSEGLADDINHGLWTKEYIEGCVGSEYYHKIRGFRKIKDEGNHERYEEMKGWFNMKIKDYFEYLDHRARRRNALEIEDAKPLSLEGTVSNAKADAKVDTAADAKADGKADTVSAKVEASVEDNVETKNVESDTVSGKSRKDCARNEVEAESSGHALPESRRSECASKKMEGESKEADISENAGVKHSDHETTAHVGETNVLEQEIVENTNDDTNTDTRLKGTQMGNPSADSTINGTDGNTGDNAALEHSSEGAGAETGKSAELESNVSGVDANDKTASDRAENPDDIFKFVDSEGVEKSVNAAEISLYMVDVDMVKLLPTQLEDFQRNYKLAHTLPGGSHCMMNSVNANGRPFMGPNLYITPPSSFTRFHQDGHGTVDSGHLCLSGYNEVVMLRRLPERHKIHALQLLNDSTFSSHSTLYGLPHSDELQPSLNWPTKEAIRKCESMGYSPSVFILKPGQTVHIGKGRLHAFRKLSPSKLPVEDCHHDLRRDIVQTIGNSENICVSIAWDWMFKGVTSEGINREVSSLLECARLNRQHNLQSLAIPETALIFLAKENVAKSQKCNPGSLIQLPVAGKIDSGSDEFASHAKSILRGILPSLKYVVNKHVAAKNSSEIWEKQSNALERVSIHSKPNTWENPDLFSLDPYGSSDFFCKLCNEELSNVYMHCDGCEKLLNKDFNICMNCFNEGNYKCFTQMHPFNVKRHSILNHTGSMTHTRKERCPCKNGKKCQHCDYCTGCSCRCHQWFTLHYRFMSVEKELELLQQAEHAAGPETLPFSEETNARLFSMGSLPLQLTPEKPEVSTIAKVESDDKNTDENLVQPGVVKIKIEQECPHPDDIPLSQLKKEKSVLANGSCVVLPHKKKFYQATIVKSKERKGGLFYRIHWVGGKKTDSCLKWVHEDEIQEIISVEGEETNTKQSSNVKHQKKKRKKEHKKKAQNNIIPDAASSSSIFDFNDDSDDRHLDGKTTAPKKLKASDSSSQKRKRSRSSSPVGSNKTKSKSDQKKKEKKARKSDPGKKSTPVKTGDKKSTAVSTPRSRKKVKVEGGSTPEQRSNKKQSSKNKPSPHTPDAVTSSSHTKGTTSNPIDVDSPSKKQNKAKSSPVATGKVKVPIKEELDPNKELDSADDHGDWQDRCPSLLPDGLAYDKKPEAPLSKYDLTDRSLSFTAPRGTIEPCPLSSKIGNLSCSDLVQFIEEARKTNRRDRIIFPLLPEQSGLTQLEVRHLFRNFSDEVIEDPHETKDHRPETRSSTNCIKYSRREIDIINYCIWKEQFCRDAVSTLIPYREKTDIEEAIGFFIDRRLNLDSRGYTSMINDTVGIIFQRENEKF